MKSAEFIQLKFQAWAQRRNIPLQGSAGERGQPNYTLSLEENLFGCALHDQTTYIYLRAGYFPLACS